MIAVAIQRKFLRTPMIILPHGYRLTTGCVLKRPWECVNAQIDSRPSRAVGSSAFRIAVLAAMAGAGPPYESNAKDRASWPEEQQCCPAGARNKCGANFVIGGTWNCGNGIPEGYSQPGIGAIAVRKTGSSRQKFHGTGTGKKRTGRTRSSGRPENATCSERR